MQFVLGILLMAQLSLPPGAGHPQVMSAAFKPPSIVKAGQKADILVSFKVIKPYAINREPQITLKVTAVPGVTLWTADIPAPSKDPTSKNSVDLTTIEISASSKDPKSKDEYFVDLPTMHVVATAAKAGKYEVPGKLTYFFCNKSDGYCSKQTVDVKIPLQVQ